MEDKPRLYILTVEYGDPNTNLALRTAVGIFQTQEEAYDYIVKQPSPYSDLVIHDLKTGEIFEETP